jgi:hypothetical protein
VRGAEIHHGDLVPSSLAQRTVKGHVYLAPALGIETPHEGDLLLPSCLITFPPSFKCLVGREDSEHRD